MAVTPLGPHTLIWIIIRITLGAYWVASSCRCTLCRFLLPAMLLLITITTNFVSIGKVGKVWDSNLLMISLTNSTRRCQNDIFADGNR
ncbi:hypothetical protein QBC47DRAFT_386924 [Echria macrotheca]|uniref:Uncharacterized protein n=1 Tax=Echria macrotheca TaxID=438768 RepID=A0AAJ0BAD3_9PEZI|nr:hypothetical protein QBC47DRAFT_386924 [Echria macrotheca]